MMFEYISGEEVIARTKLQLGLRVTDYDDFFRILVNEGERRIMSVATVIKQNLEVDIIDGKIKLPCGFYELIQLQLTDPAVDGTEIASCWIPQYVPTSVYRCNNNCSNLVNYNINISFQLVDGYAFFDSGVSASKAVLAYKGLNIDETGVMIKIPEHHEVCLSMYLQEQFNLMRMNSQPELAYQYRAIAQEFGRKFSLLKAQLIGLDGMPDKSERRYIASIWKSQLPNTWAYNYL